MALPWLIKDAIDTTLYKADSSVSLLRYPLLILGAADAPGLFPLWLAHQY